MRLLGRPVATLAMLGVVPFLMMADAYALTVVASSGTSAPGTTGNYDFFVPPTTEGGEICFTAHLTGTGITTANDNGVWSSVSGTVSLVSQEGDGTIAAPGAYSNVFTSGGIGYEAKVVVSGISKDAVLDDLGIVAKAGDVAPGSGGTKTFNTFTNFKNGDTAFHSILSPSGNAGLYKANGVTKVIATGDIAPGTSLQVTSIITTGGLNSSGNFAYIANLASAVAPRRGIWGPGGVVALEGDVAPGTGGQLFDDFGGASISGDNVAFNATYGSGLYGIFFYDGTLNTLHSMAKGGDLAPGTGGKTFNGLSLYNAYFPADGNGIAFVATAGSPAVNGVWYYALSGRQIVAIQGDAAPGTSETFASFSDVVMDGNGRVAFKAVLTGSASTNQGIFIYDTNTSTLSLAVRKGDTITVGGVGKTITTITLASHASGNDDGRGNYFASNGDIAFQATYSGGEAIVVGNF